MKKGIIMKKFVWIAALVAVSFVFWGCSSSDNGGTAFEDYTTGVMETLGAVPADGTKTLQAGTADTHEVETDGNWIVWKGRSINLGYYDGSTVADLDTGLGGSVTPWAFGYCDQSPIGFDGTTIVAVANDVASADLPEFYYYRPGDGTGGAIDLPFDGDKDLADNYEAYVSGDLAVVADNDGMKAYRAFLSDDTPAFTEFIIDNEPTGIVGVNAAAIDYDNGCVQIYDISADPITVTTLIGDGNSDTDPYDFQTHNDIFTWVEDGTAYYYEPGVSTNSVEIYASENDQYDPVAGPDYFLWYQEGGEGSVVYLAKADVGSDPVVEPTPVAFEGWVGYLEDVKTGDGFFAYIDEDGNEDDQIFVYDLSDDQVIEGVYSATEGAPVTENGEGADAGPKDWEDDSQLYVDGTKIYEIFNYRGVSNPSRVLVMYDFETKELLELTDDRDFQQVPVYLAAGGKAVFLHRDRHFRLFAKKADDTAKPVTLTPLSLRIDGEDCQQIALANGVVVFKAIDRNRFIDNPWLADEVGQGEMRELYYIDLDGARTIKQITEDSRSEKGKPQTDGAFVTWRDHKSYVWAYEIATGEKKMLGYGYSKISIDNGIAIWKYDPDIYYYDLNTDEGDVIEDANPSGYCPTIADGLITWCDNVNYHPCYYDLNADSPEIVDIYAVEPEDYTVGDIYKPLTDGTYIAWKETRTGWDHDGDDGVSTDPISADVIVAYDTESGELLTIPADDGEGGVDWTETYSVCYPRISDGVVVFGAVEYGVPNDYIDGDKEIFYCDLTAATLELVRLTNDPNDDEDTIDVDEDAGLWDSRPQIANGLIVWRTGGSSQWDWKGRSVAAARLY
jgi:hypothetical protein